MVTWIIFVINIFINKNVMTHTRDLVQQRRYLGLHLK